MYLITNITFFQTLCLKFLSILFETIPIHIFSVNTVFRRFTCYCEIKCIFFSLIAVHCCSYCHFIQSKQDRFYFRKYFSGVFLKYFSLHRNYISISQWKYVLNVFLKVRKVHEIAVSFINKHSFTAQRFLSLLVTKLWIEMIT